MVEVKKSVKVRKPSPIPAAGLVSNLLKPINPIAKSKDKKHQTILIATSTPTTVTATASAPNTLKKVAFERRERTVTPGRRVYQQFPEYSQELDDFISNINLNELTLAESLHVTAAENYFEGFVNFMNNGRLDSDRPPITANVRDVKLLKSFANYLSFKIKVNTIRNTIRILLKLESFQHKDWHPSVDFMAELNQYYITLKVIFSFISLIMCNSINIDEIIYTY